VLIFFWIGKPGPGEGSRGVGPPSPQKINTTQLTRHNSTHGLKPGPLKRADGRRDEELCVLY